MPKSILETEREELKAAIAALRHRLDQEEQSLPSGLVSATQIAKLDRSVETLPQSKRGQKRPHADLLVPGPSCRQFAYIRKLLRLSGLKRWFSGFPSWRPPSWYANYMIVVEWSKDNTEMTEKTKVAPPIIKMDDKGRTQWQH
jgi:hypothetical protein